MPLAVIPFLLLPHAAARDDLPTHFAFSGPLKDLAAGASVSPVRSGVQFSVTLADGGKSISTGAFDLKVSGSDKPLKLALDGLKYDNGRLSADAKVTNTTGSAVEGVRVDLTGAVETYKAKDENGKDILKTRGQKVGLPSPLYYGDLDADEAAGPFAFDAATISFQPETTQVVVTGVVSGLRYEKTWPAQDGARYQIDVDSKGAIYVSAGEAICRFDAATGGRSDFVKLEANQAALVDPNTGDIWTVAGNHKVIRFSPDGKEKSKWDAETNGLEWVTLGLRMDKQGRLYNCGDNNRCIQCISPAGKKVWKTELPEDQGYLFDVDSSGRVYASGGDSAVVRLDPDGKNLGVFAGGNDWHPGKIIGPVSVRIDTRSGLIYIVESGRDMNEEHKLSREEPRISVFDQNGGFVRLWGRGALHQPADKKVEGFVYRPTDLAFGPEGRVYVLCEGHEGGNVLMAFRQF